MIIRIVPKRDMDDAYEEFASIALTTHWMLVLLSQKYTYLFPHKFGLYSVSTTIK